VLNEWELLLSELRNKSIYDKLVGVNDFFNQIEYATDEKNWEELEYWATPFEFLEKEKGDCEDYTIGKYFTLKMLGIPEKDLRLLHVSVVDQVESHMVLSYGSTLLILDNATDDIKTLVERNDLKVNYSFNNETMWNKNNVVLGTGYRFVGLWRDMFERFKLQYEERYEPFDF